MEMIDQLDARGVREAIRHGLGVDGLCDKYKCEPGALFLRMQHLYRYNSQDMIQRLRDSGRKVSGIKIKKNTSKTAAPETTKGTTQEEAVQEATAPATGDDGEVNPISEKEVIATDEQNTALEALKEKETALSKALMDIECDYEVMLNKHRGKIAQLRDAQSELKTIEAKFNEQMAKYQKLVSEDDQLVDELNKLLMQRRESAAVLAELREEIEVLEATTICAYENGTIGVFEGAEIEINTTGSSEIFGRIVELTECENLRVKEIKLISEVIAAVKNAERRVEVVVENPAVAEVYEALAEKLDGANPA
ncbi:hypothetical protein IJJ37_02895 [Candidatus Saccharibacteria bacterium]|nr:hypothetical protein [Candidatus Saccharibacteria bacterium]